jgi:hypothetical protein
MKRRTDPNDNNNNNINNNNNNQITTTTTKTTKTSSTTTATIKQHCTVLTMYLSFLAQTRLTHCTNLT